VPIIGAVDETFIWALFDRHPLPRWTAAKLYGQRIDFVLS
jgi:hypothetical protein